MKKYMLLFLGINMSNNLIGMKKPSLIELDETTRTKKCLNFLLKDPNNSCSKILIQDLSTEIIIDEQITEKDLYRLIYNKETQEKKVSYIKSTLFGNRETPKDNPDLMDYFLEIFLSEKKKVEIKNKNNN